MKRSNKSRLSLGDEGEPQIPWAKETKVVKIYENRDGIFSVDLESGGTKAGIDRWGTVSIEINSRDNILSGMHKSEELTQSLREYRGEDYADLDFITDDAKKWLKGDPAARKLPWGSGTPGVFDWWPAEGEPFGRQKIGKISHHRMGRPSEMTEDWIGSDFQYVHFELEDGGDEGLVIAWNEKHNPHSNLETLDNAPEVWLGDVDAFFSTNEERFEDFENYAGWNNGFENGFLWALDQMGAFDGAGIPEWAVEVIKNDPDLLWPDLVDKLLPRLRSLPEELEKAVLTWLGRRRREAEEAVGQTRFWPEAGEERGQ